MYFFKVFEVQYFEVLHTPVLNIRRHTGMEWEPWGTVYSSTYRYNLPQKSRAPRYIVRIFGKAIDTKGCCSACGNSVGKPRAAEFSEYVLQGGIYLPKYFEVRQSC